MKKIHKILNYLEDFKPKYTLKIRWSYLILLTLLFWLIHNFKDSFAGTNRIPEPFNIFNHIGNVDSVIPALLVCIISALIFTRIWNPKKAQHIFWISMTAGIVVGLICNILIELPWGMNLLDQPNIADPLDIIYGTLFSAATCFVAIKLSLITSE